jgi:two-component system, OmpR family, catabolic regulation response regulator CreB
MLTSSLYFKSDFSLLDSPPLGRRAIPILIIEDEPAIADTLLFALSSEGFGPHWCATAAAGLAALQAQAFALLVLDVGLPDAHGFDFCKQLRAAGHDLPILFLTARSAEIDRIIGLEIGGDDYLTKPFSPRELATRVKVILRRARPAPPLIAAAAATPPPLPQIASAPSSPFTHDAARCRIAYHGQPLELTRIEYRLLLVFLAQPGRVYTREQLLAAAWDEPEASLDRTVDAHVKTLRTKLRAVAPAADPIQTHRGLGYSLRD